VGGGGHADGSVTKNCDVRNTGIVGGTSLDVDGRGRVGEEPRGASAGHQDLSDGLVATEGETARRARKGVSAKGVEEAHAGASLASGRASGSMAAPGAAASLDVGGNNA
jgi:hypothetical protein